MGRHTAIALAIFGFASVASLQRCEGKDEGVFAVQRSNGKIVGSTFLVDSKYGVLVTAAHVLHDAFLGVSEVRDFEREEWIGTKVKIRLPISEFARRRNDPEYLPVDASIVSFGYNFWENDPNLKASYKDYAILKISKEGLEHIRDFQFYVPRLFEHKEVAFERFDADLRVIGFNSLLQTYGAEWNRPLIARYLTAQVGLNREKRGDESYSSEGTRVFRFNSTRVEVGLSGGPLVAERRGTNAFGRNIGGMGAMGVVVSWVGGTGQMSGEAIALQRVIEDLITSIDVEETMEEGESNFREIITALYSERTTAVNERQRLVRLLKKLSPIELYSLLFYLRDEPLVYVNSLGAKLYNPIALDIIVRFLDTWIARWQPAAPELERIVSAREDAEEPLREAAELVFEKTGGTAPTPNEWLLGYAANLLLLANLEIDSVTKLDFSGRENRSVANHYTKRLETLGDLIEEAGLEVRKVEDTTGRIPGDRYQLVTTRIDKNPVVEVEPLVSSVFEPSL